MSYFQKEWGIRVTYEISLTIYTVSDILYKFTACYQSLINTKRNRMVNPEELQHIERISMKDVRRHYDVRVVIHKRLVKLLKDGYVQEYVNLALGMEDPHGNYSAHEHKLGPRILSESSPSSVFQLAKELYSCNSVTHVPKIIHESNLPYLKISVGSEMATLLNPNKFWVGNVRTIMAQLLIKHGWDYDAAGNELRLSWHYDTPSEMAYPVWREIYLTMEPNLNVLIEMGNEYASQSGVKSGKLKYLWADAIANALYEYEEKD